MNPAAGRGRAAGFIPAARAALESVGGSTLIQTNGRGDEARCAREALDRGATTLVVLGGDGTVSQAACELVRAKSQVPLAIFGAGTGNDFAYAIGLPVHDYGAVTRLIAENRIRTVDAGRIDNRVFVNSVGFGFDAEIVARTQRSGGFLKGNAVYVTTALSQLFQYVGFSANVTQGANSTGARQWLMIVFANGGRFGGTFRIAPDARIDDGLLDGIFIGNASTFKRTAIFARATSGEHVRYPEVQVTRHSRYEIEFSTTPGYQADGEFFQATSSTVIVEALPAALRVIA
ncbi:MAG: YegS/Rv2252/BmrU family lipid kinase [Gemmatimonadaceae bacterium]